MEKLLRTFPIGGQARRILYQICDKHDIKRIKDFVDIYRHKPDLLFEEKGLSQECWDEISKVLSDPGNPYIPQETVISYRKAKLIVKRNRLIDDLTELTKEIQDIE